MNVLTVTDARKRFGPITALDGVTLELRQGELLALLGPNGAGKTTLIRAVAGRVRLNDGEMRVFGELLPGWPCSPGAGDRAAGDRALSVDDRPREPRGLRRTAVTLRWRVDGLSGVGARAHRSARPRRRTRPGLLGRHAASSQPGLRHRPTAADPAARRTHVGVDPQSRDRIYDMLAALMDDGVSILLTTHHLEEAEARCSRTVILDHGRVIAAGTLPELVGATVGRDRLVTLRLTSGRVLEARMQDVAAELPPLLDEVRRTGAAIDDVEVRRPSLQGRVHSSDRTGASRMILTLLKVGWLNLMRDRVAQALTFLLPIVFFSIFASVLGGQSSQTTRVRVAVVDEDGSELSARIVRGLTNEPGLRVRTHDAEGTVLDRTEAEELVRNGDVPVVASSRPASAPASARRVSARRIRRSCCWRTCRTPSPRRLSWVSCKRS